MSELSHSVDSADALVAALALASMGLRVLWLPYGQKRCITPRWQDVATTDTTAIRSGYRHPMNLAVVMGHYEYDRDLVCVDDDGGLARAYESGLPPLPGTLTSTSAGGPKRFYWAPTARVGPKRNHWRGLAIDVLSGNTYAIVGPSLHPGGAPYVTTGGAIAELPAAWLDAVWPVGTPRLVPAPRAPAGTVDRARAYIAQREPAIEGQNGSGVTYTTALHLVRGFSLSEADAMVLMREYNVRCKPPWDDAELARKVSEASKSGAEDGYLLNAPRAAAANRPVSPDSSPLASGDSGDSWESELHKNKDQFTYSNDLHNATLIVKNTDDWRIGHDDFAKRTTLLKLPPCMPPSLWSSPREFTDDDAAYLRRWFQRSKYKLNLSLSDIRDVIRIESKDYSYHPVGNYLNSLEWDRVPRIDTWLTDYLGVDDNLYTRAVGAKWLMSAVQRIQFPGCKCDYALVLGGKQGVNKSTVFSILGGDWYTSHIADVHDKDEKASEQLQGVWIVEFEEITQDRDKVNSIKRFITRPFDRFRMAYAERNKRFDRECVFGATTNEREWSDDTTGARRFWPVWCVKADIDGLVRDRDQLWAEAYARESAHEKIWINDSDIHNMAEEAQEGVTSSDPWEEPIADYMAKEGVDRGGRVSLYKLMEHMRISTQNMSSAHAKRVVKIMQKQGMKSTPCKENGKTRKYWVKA